MNAHKNGTIDSIAKKNAEIAILIGRLKEANISLRRFLKVGNDKKAFEREWQNRLYLFEEISNRRTWGLCARDGLAFIDVDKKIAIEYIRKKLPLTFETISPRRLLPHFYFKVIGGVVPNRTLLLPKQLLKGEIFASDETAGELRANNEYVVAPGSFIRYKDLKTGEHTSGTYRVLHDRPIATVTYKDLMEALRPLMGTKKNSSQRITYTQMRQGVPAGMRHAQGMKMAAFLVKVIRFDSATALQAMQTWNKLCTPPMDNKDLERMVRNAINYPDREQKKRTRDKTPAFSRIPPDEIELRKYGHKVRYNND